MARETKGNQAKHYYFYQGEGAFEEALTHVRFLDMRRAEYNLRRRVNRHSGNRILPRTFMEKLLRRPARKERWTTDMPVYEIYVW